VRLGFGRKRATAAVADCAFDGGSVCELRGTAAIDGSTTDRPDHVVGIAKL
jgi:hypothetical protein